MKEEAGTLKVIAAKGLRVPMERSRKYIFDKPVQVPVTVYYLRRLRTGELLVVKPDQQGGRSGDQ